MKKQIIINMDNLNSVAPLYYQFDGQCQTQPAYIEIDPRSDSIEVSADYDGNIGGGCSALHWHNLVATIPVPAGVLGSALIQHMNSDKFKGDVLELCEGYEEHWNGNNYVGRWSEDSRDLEQVMEYQMHDLQNAEIYTGEEWIESDIHYFNEDGYTCDCNDAIKCFYGDGSDQIEIITENLDKLVLDAEQYIDENCQMVEGLKAAFESIIEDLT